MGLPNQITLARIALIPVFVWLAYGTDTQRVASFVVFAIASASDSLDGYIARARGSQSRLGEVLDPLADKLLVGTALYVLVATRDFPLWAALLIGVREVAVQVLRTHITRTGGAMPASSPAKLKTLLQVAMVSYWLLPLGDPGIVHWVLMSVALAATLLTGAMYFTAAARQRTAA